MSIDQIGWTMEDALGGPDPINGHESDMSDAYRNSRESS